MVVAAIVLAAGGGSRFGGPKALVELEGQRLVDRAIATADAAACAPVVVVLGAAAGQVRPTLAQGARAVVNPDWREGMGSSLNVGLAALEATDAAAAVVLLVDQPRIGPEVIARLVRAWRGGARVAVATYEGRPRNPVLFDRTVWPAARAAAVGDAGARALVRARPDLTVEVACGDIADPVDIDTPADLARLSPPPRT